MVVVGVVIVCAFVILADVSVLAVLVCGRLLLLWFNAGWRWGCHCPNIKSSTSLWPGQFVNGQRLSQPGAGPDFCSHDPVLTGQHGPVRYSTGSVLGQY